MKSVPSDVATNIIAYIIKAFGNPIPGPHLVAYFADGRMQGSGLSATQLGLSLATDPFLPEYQKILVDQFADHVRKMGARPEYIASAIRTDIIMPATESSGKATHLLLTITKTDTSEQSRFFTNLCPCGCGKHQHIVLPLEWVFPNLEIPCPLTPELLKLLPEQVYARSANALALKFSAN